MQHLLGTRGDSRGTDPLQYTCMNSYRDCVGIPTGYSTQSAKSQPRTGHTREPDPTHNDLKHTITRKTAAHERNTVRVIFEIRISQQQCLECYCTAGFPVSQSVSYFTVPPRAHPPPASPPPFVVSFRFLVVSLDGKNTHSGAANTLKYTCFRAASKYTANTQSNTQVDATS